MPDAVMPDPPGLERVSSEQAPFEQELLDNLPRLRRYALQLTRERGRADDLLQSALLRAIAKQDLWQPGTDLRAWLFTILHNQYVNDIRRSVRQAADIAEVGDGVIEAIPARIGDPLASLELQEMRAMLSRLPRSVQRILVLAAVHGERYEDMAAYEMIPVGTVRSRLSRARTMLRTLMRGVDLSPEEVEKLSVAAH